MNWNTRITRLVDIKYPIIQGALAMIGRAELAAAVSEAGGLGMITAWTLKTPEKLRTEIRKTRSLTDKPFAVNLSPTVDPALIPMREVAIEEKVPVIETAGYQSTEHGKRIKDAGLIWFHKVQSVRHALSAERDGADAVCIMGIEGAGLKSPGMLTTFVSVAMAASSLTIPVIAAGGIGNARTFLGALALGADAVLMGTVFCSTTECPTSERRKQVLVDADPYDPNWRNPILHTPAPEDLQNLLNAEGTKNIMLAAGKAERSGIPKEAGIETVSLAIGFIKDIPTTKELIDRIISEAEEILKVEGIGGWKLAP